MQTDSHLRVSRDLFCLSDTGPMELSTGPVAQQDGLTARWNGSTGTFSILRGETTLHQLV